MSAQPRRDAWTPDEDAILRELYLAAGVDATCEQLPGRSRDAVKQRALNIGAAKPCKWRKRRKAACPIAREGWLTDEQREVLALLRAGWSAEQHFPERSLPLPDEYTAWLRSMDGRRVVEMPVRTLERLVEVGLVKYERGGERGVWRVVVE